MFEDCTRQNEEVKDCFYTETCIKQCRENVMINVITLSLMITFSIRACRHIAVEISTTRSTRISTMIIMN